ncbi:TPR-like protein [Serendipita vermifera]|nr:TPR-like protein [Serendipita vermifera]
MTTIPNKPINYLSIDGGSSALSALYIIDEMFQRLEYDTHSDEELRPCDWFDLIVGSGTGGILALLLGRLRMTASEAIEAYSSLESVMATRPAETKEDLSSNTLDFAKAFKKIVDDRGLDEGALMELAVDSDHGCKVAICTLSPANMSLCQFIRSYRIRGKRAPKCTIIQAACATIASPGIYEPLVLNQGHNQASYIDATAGYANPTNEGLKEAEKVFGKDQIVATIISVGSGKTSFRFMDNIADEDQVANLFRRIATDTEQVHKDVQNRLRELDIYYRFNVEDMSTSERRDEGTVKLYSSAYLEEDVVSQRLDSTIISIREREGIKPLKELNSIGIVNLAYRQRPAVVPFFVGREDILDKLQEIHLKNPPNETEQPRISVLTGLGGSGKTQIALQFAKQFENVDPSLLVFFVDASSEDRIKQDYQTIIRSRGATYRSAPYEAALQWFSTTESPWIVIADNADDPSLSLVPFLPKSRHGHFIVTSRNATRSLMAPNHSYHIGDMSVDDSITLLLRISGYEGSELNIGHAKQVVLALGCLPLAVAQAAGYIHTHRCLATYPEIYQDSRAQILSQRSNELPHDYSLSVATTLDMSFTKLPERSKDVLLIFSFFHNTSISHNIITTAAQNKFFYASGNASRADDDKLDDIKQESANFCGIFCPRGHWSEYEFNEIIQPCLQYSLLQVITSQDQHKFYSMHILVQTWLRLVPQSDGRPSFKDLARRMLLSNVQRGSSYDHFTIHYPLLPHLKPFAGGSLGVAGDDILLHQVLNDSRDFRLSNIHLTSYLSKADQKLTEHEPEKLEARCDLIWVYLQLGRYHEAVEVGEDTVAACVAALGKEEHLTLRSMSHLAYTYHLMGKYEHALKENLELLSTRQRVLGPEHQDTLASRNNLALTYSQMGNHNESQKLNQLNLELKRKILGLEHPDTLISMSNLALDYQNSGHYQVSKALNEETLALRRKVLGTDHPDTLTSMSNLAIDLHHSGQYNEALELDKQVLKLREKILGPEHPDTLVSIASVAVDYFELGEYDRALELERQALDVRKKELGPEHPGTLLSMSNLATELCQLGKINEAMELDQETLAIRKKVLGVEHSDTLVSMNNLAGDYRIIEDYDKARCLDEEALAIRKRTLGPEHPHTLLSMCNLAVDYNKLGRHTEARELGEQTLALRTKVLGPEHPDTLSSMSNLAREYQQIGESDQARDLGEQTLALRRKVLGAEHPDTLVSMNNLSLTYSQ